MLITLIRCSHKICLFRSRNGLFQLHFQPAKVANCLAIVYNVDMEKTTTKKTVKTPIADPSFEAYAARLKSISESLERGGLTIDEAIVLFEESVGLSKQCMELLTAKRGKITELKKQLDGLSETDIEL